MVANQVIAQLGLRYRMYQEMEPQARHKGGLSVFNLFIVVLVLLSFLALALETEPTIGPEWRRAITLFNLAIIIIFAVEYMLRLWVAG